MIERLRNRHVDLLVTFGSFIGFGFAFGQVLQVQQGQQVPEALQVLQVQEVQEVPEAQQVCCWLLVLRLQAY